MEALCSADIFNAGNAGISKYFKSETETLITTIFLLEKKKLTCSDKGRKIFIYKHNIIKRSVFSSQCKSLESRKYNRTIVGILHQKSVY